MIDDHHKDVAEFDNQAGSGTSLTASLARAQAPILRKHRGIAERLPR
jgi:hypothetical protein